MLRDSVVVVRTRPRAIPLAMIAIRKILHGFPFLSRDAYGAPLSGPSGRRSSAKNRLKSSWQNVHCVCALKKRPQLSLSIKYFEVFWTRSTANPGLFQLGLIRFLKLNVIH